MVYFVLWEKFSISNNCASDKPLWLWYYHWAKLTLYFEWIFYPCIGHLETISSRSYVVLPDVAIFHYQMRLYQAITFIHITTYIIRNVFKYWEAATCMVLDTSIPKFYLPKSLSLLAINIASYFSWSDGLTSFIFEKMYDLYLSLNS